MTNSEAIAWFEMELKYFNNCYAYKKAIEALWEVERLNVVRCKDCKHLVFSDCMENVARPTWALYAPMIFAATEKGGLKMNDEPRECPYCGSGNIEVCIVDEAYCECCDCGAYGPGAEIDYAAHEGNEDAAINEAYDAAIVLWNRRYADNAEIH